MKPQEVIELEKVLGFGLREEGSLKDIMSYNNSESYFLNEEKKIIGLNLYNSNLKDISFLQGLINLTDLNLGGNQINDISSLKDLINLTNLYLYGNQISDISFLKDLINLTWLGLRKNQISDISFLKDLINLTDLYLYGNQISDISFLKNLNNLMILDLRENKISNISFLKDLNNLMILNLFGNQISDISFLKDLNNLTWLDLRDNKVSDISFLKDLNNLTWLDLCGNQISDVSFLKLLNNLTSLDLRRNKITNISSDFLNSLIKLNSLILFDNPISNIPKEILKYGNALKSVRTFLEDLQKGTKKNNEIKIIFIGNGSVGKTQVAKRLVEKEDFKFDTQHNSTHAIQLLQTKIDCALFEKEGLLLNIWDFGGQDLFHATHRLFMQTKAIFVLVWDAENEKNEYHEWEGKQYKNEKLRYWLEYSHFFGKESPILVVQNKIDDLEHAKNEMPAPEQKEYQKAFPNIAKFIKASAKRGTGFDVICNSIEVLLEKNEILRKDVMIDLPTSWVNIRKRVREEQAKENGLKKISKADFTAWCEAEEVAKSTDTILDYLYHTGVLYYNEHLFLGEIILDQAWLIEAIYKILDRQGVYAEILEGNEGQLEYRDLKKIWKDNSDKERETFMFYMLNAELCFETTKKTEQSHTALKDRTFVVPQLLSAEKPTYIEDYANENELTEQKQIPYKFLPTVFMYRFIIRAKDLAEIEDMWQSGIYLHYEGQYAIVEANYETQQIVIRYNQAAKKDLLRVIEEEFEKINDNVPIKAEKGEVSFFDKRWQKGFDRINVQKLKQDKNMKTIKIFLASSAELKEDRDALRLFLSVENDRFHKKDIYFELVQWEYFLDAVSDTRMQNEYNKALEDCDIVLSLFFTRAGKYTQEEFEKALAKFKETGKPRIYTYFKDAPVNMGDIDEKAFNSLSKFKKRLAELGHFPSKYTNIDDLKVQFKRQLEIYLDEM